MILKGARQAREFTSHLAEAVTHNDITGGLQTLEPIIHDKNPFRLLDLVGAGIADCHTAALFPFLDAIAASNAEGGWVVIASALHSHHEQSMPFRLQKAQDYIIQADIWYGADIFGERVPGPFLLENFNCTLDQLTAWTHHPNPWIRRTMGVAVHFWAKRTRSEENQIDHALLLLDLLAPLLEERDMRAAKGIGWGLKTLGRYFPETAAEWLREQLLIQRRCPFAVVRRKALTYLPDHIKGEFSK